MKIHVESPDMNFSENISKRTKFSSPLIMLRIKPKPFYSNYFEVQGSKDFPEWSNIRILPQGKLYRPLLDISPQKLRDYLVKNNINWIEDDSNLNNNYRRNFLRNQVFPEILKQFPDAIEKISQSGKNLKTTYDWLNELSSSNTTSLKLETLNNTDKKYQSTLLYQWLSQKNIPLPDKSTIQQIVHDFTNAANDKNPHFRNKYYQLIRFRDEIFCIKIIKKLTNSKSMNGNLMKFSNCQTVVEHCSI